ncbi:MAG TPA: dephospho-CoA kinase [Prolixibacteraceae bacterium]|nr:dephospho-CoA kinase [Prolixibacteraceae bacterium]
MIKVGITGGIGSGKSTVCKVFRVLGIPVFEADSTAKQLMNTDPSLREQLIQLFGPAVYLPNLTIDRKYLAGIVFSNAPLLRKLNEIVHPAVRKAFDEWFLIQHSPYVIHEAAILFESGFYKLMDKTIMVVTNENERIERVVKRDQITAEMVRQRMKNQWSDEKKIKLADFVIGNNDNELIIPQIIEIDKKLKANG